MTSPLVAAAPPENLIVLLPIGSVEQHSYHLPTGTDAMLCQAVASEVERRRSETVLLAPPVWYGASSHHLGFAGTASLGSEVLIDQIVSIVRSLARSSNFCTFFILNGHGGNEPAMRIALEHLRSTESEIHAYAVSYWDPMIAALRDAGEPLQGMGHACELETSMMMAVRGELVDVERVEADSRTGEPWLYETRGFKEMTAHGGMGDPTSATAERGRRLLDLAVGEVCGLVDRLGTSPF